MLLTDGIVRLCSAQLSDDRHSRSPCELMCQFCRAGKELYVAETDGKVLVKIGSAKWEPDAGKWSEADSGKAWAVYVRV